jgi:hypothetical protein
VKKTVKDRGKTVERPWKDRGDGSCGHCEKKKTGRTVPTVPGEQSPLNAFNEKATVSEFENSGFFLLLGFLI